MLESALEELLVGTLTPYLDGISLDNLHLGVFSGSVELKDLKVKKDALTLLGLEGLRCRTGSIRLIKLVVPWNKLYTGKLRAILHGVHLEVEHIGDTSTSELSDAKLVQDMQDMKRRAIELRVSQLRYLLDQQREHSDADLSSHGYAMKLVRKIVNNIHIDLSDVQVTFISASRGFACGLELPNLAILSTDQTFRERSDTQEVNVTGTSMYKLLRLNGLGIRVAPAGCSTLLSAEYVKCSVCHQQTGDEYAQAFLKGIVPVFCYSVCAVLFAPAEASIFM